VQLVRKAQPALMVLPEPRVLRVQPVPMAQLERQAQQVLRVQLDQTEPRVQLDHKDRRESQVQLDHRVQLVLTALQDPRVLKAIKVLLE